MLGIPPVACPTEATAHLTAIQAEIDGKTDFHERVDHANACWASRKNNAAFDAIKVALNNMRAGKFYCCYCETNTTCPIEHIYPKSLFPERAFVWENYLPVCGRCNSEVKGDKWAIFDPSGVFIDVTPPKGPSAPRRTPPPAGTPVFLDLRQENPLDLITLDFADFRFLPLATLSATDQKRVEYTVETVLNLNEPDMCKARSTGYGNIRHRFDEYLSRRNLTNPAIEQKAKAIFHDFQHPTVWKEMQRQHTHPWFARLFQQAPETLSW